MLQLRRLLGLRWLRLALILLPLAVPVAQAQNSAPAQPPAAAPNDEITSRWPQDGAPNTSGSAAGLPQGIGVPEGVRGIPDEAQRAQVPPQPQGGVEGTSAPTAATAGQPEQSARPGGSKHQAAKPRSSRSAAPARNQRATYARAGKAARAAKPRSAKPSAAVAAKGARTVRRAGRPLALAPPVVRAARGQL